MAKFQYELCSKILQKYPDDDIRELVAAYIATQAEVDCQFEELLELNGKNTILEAENRLLKEHPTGCGDPDCGNGWGCLCYTR